MRHEDNRRTLTEFGNGKDWRLCKVVIIKKDCVLGNHHHKEKDESFMLIKGTGYFNKEEMILFKEYFVSRGTVHEFFLTENSILISLATKEFDPDDEISNSN